MSLFKAGRTFWNGQPFRSAGTKIGRCAFIGSSLLNASSGKTVVIVAGSLEPFIADTLERKRKHLQQ